MQPPEAHRDLRLVSPRQFGLARINHHRAGVISTRTPLRIVVISTPIRASLRVFPPRTPLRIVIVSISIRASLRVFASSSSSSIQIRCRAALRFFFRFQRLHFNVQRLDLLPLLIDLGLQLPLCGLQTAQLLLRLLQFLRNHIATNRCRIQVAFQLSDLPISNRSSNFHTRLAWLIKSALLRTSFSIHASTSSEAFRFRSEENRFHLTHRYTASAISRISASNPKSYSRTPA